MPFEERARWSAEKQKAYDLARLRHHSNLPVLPTSDTGRIVGQVLLQLEANLHAQGTLCGGIITGPATYGKTTLLADIGRRYEHQFRHSYPPENPADAARIIPVVMVGLAPEATAKKLNISIAEFYGAALRRRETTRDEYKRVIRERVYLHHTQLIMIDDIHYLRRPETQRQRDQMASLNNHVKNLADELGVTFLFAGINVDGTGLFDEGSSTTDTVFSQVGGRMARYELRGFPHGSDEWKKLLNAFETELVLEDHEPKSLRKLADYLHHRTNGSIGSLTNLLKQAALLAVAWKQAEPKKGEDRKPERIDHSVLQKVKSDRNAEANFQRHGSLYVPASKAKA